MLGLIDLPSPFAPIKELQESLRHLEAIPEQDDPQIKNCIAQVRQYLARAETLGRKD